MVRPKRYSERRFFLPPVSLFNHNISVIVRRLTEFCLCTLDFLSTVSGVFFFCTRLVCCTLRFWLLLYIRDVFRFYEPSSVGAPVVFLYRSGIRSSRSEANLRLVCSCRLWVSRSEVNLRLVRCEVSTNPLWSHHIFSAPSLNSLGSAKTGGFYRPTWLGTDKQLSL